MLNHALIENLKKIAGEENLQILPHRIDISPENSLAISQIVKLANQEKFRVIPVGTGTSLDAEKLLTGSTIRRFDKLTVPSEVEGQAHGAEQSRSTSSLQTGKELFLKSNRLNKIKRVVAEDLYAILEPGFFLKDLNEKLQSFNLFYPLAGKTSKGTVGGAVASNLRGNAKERSLQTRDYVLALEVVDPQGEILKVGARTFKSVTGYDLPRLFVGSWGTLGVITEISLRLVPLGKREAYENLIFEVPKRNPSKTVTEIKDQDDYSTILSSRIKKSLDPNRIFPDLQCMVTKGP
jgi:glycolate oxidase